jgi:hypothetical protein
MNEKPSLQILNTRGGVGRLDKATCGHKRYLGDRASAARILDSVLYHRPRLNITNELRDPRTRLEDTAAGLVITQEIRRREERRWEEWEEERREAEQALLAARSDLVVARAHPTDQKIQQKKKGKGFIILK